MPTEAPKPTDFYYLFPEGGNVPNVSEIRRLGVPYAFWPSAQGLMVYSTKTGQWTMPEGAQEFLDRQIERQQKADAARAAGQAPTEVAGGTKALKGKTAIEAEGERQLQAGVSGTQATGAALARKAGEQAEALAPRAVPTPAPTPTPSPTPTPVPLTPEEQAMAAQMVKDGLAKTEDEAAGKIRARAQAQALQGVQP